jgi:signal transduction histidine kinase
VIELQESRAKLIEVSMAERRRLERDLHDGAQQRLVALSVQVGMARRKLHDDPAAAEELLDRAGGELRLALEELRELARGIHPAILTDRGLVPALEMLAGRAAIPVALSAALDDRPPGPVEAAAYYIVAEALTNASRHARASHADVRVRCENGSGLFVEVADDGVGGADQSRGSGVRGLGDRVEALGGTLELDSPPGAGTTLIARIPYRQRGDGRG